MRSALSNNCIYKFSSQGQQGTEILLIFPIKKFELFIRVKSVYSKYKLIMSLSGNYSAFVDISEACVADKDKQTNFDVLSGDKGQ